MKNIGMYGVPVIYLCDTHLLEYYNNLYYFSKLVKSDNRNRGLAEALREGKISLERFGSEYCVVEHEIVKRGLPSWRHTVLDVKVDIYWKRGDGGSARGVNSDLDTRLFNAWVVKNKAGGLKLLFDLDKQNHKLLEMKNCEECLVRAFLENVLKRDVKIDSE